VPKHEKLNAKIAVYEKGAKFIIVDREAKFIGLLQRNWRSNRKNRTILADPHELVPRLCLGTD